MSLKIQALRAKYEAQRLEALATLEIYVKNSVGIGEHAQVIEEMDKLVKAVDEADGCIETLDRIFVTDANSTEGTTAVNG